MTFVSVYKRFLEMIEDDRAIKHSENFMGFAFWALNSKN